MYFITTVGVTKNASSSPRLPMTRIRTTKALRKAGCLLPDYAWLAGAMGHRPHFHKTDALKRRMMDPP